MAYYRKYHRSQHYFAPNIPLGLNVCTLIHFIIFWKFEYFTVFWFGPADISIERSWITRGLKPEAVESVPADWWCGRSLFNEGWNQRWTKERPVVLSLLSLEKQKEWGFERVTGSTHIPLSAFPLLPRIWIIRLWDMRSHNLIRIYE